MVFHTGPLCEAERGIKARCKVPVGHVAVHQGQTEKVFTQITEDNRRNYEIPAVFLAATV